MGKFARDKREREAVLPAQRLHGKPKVRLTVLQERLEQERQEKEKDPSQRVAGSDA